MKKQRLHLKMVFNILNIPNGSIVNPLTICSSFDGIDIMRVRDQKKYFCPATYDTIGLDTTTEPGYVTSLVDAVLEIPNEVDEDIPNTYIISRIKFDLDQDLDYITKDITGEWIDSDGIKIRDAIIFNMCNCVDKDVW